MEMSRDEAEPKLKDLPEGIDPAIQVFLTVSRSLPSLRNVFESLLSKIHLAAFLTDLFGIDTFYVAKEYNVPSYIFFPSPASALSLLLHIPKLDETVPCEFRDLPGPVIKIPGCILIHAKDLPEPLQERKSGMYEWILRAGKRFSSLDGIAVNSFTDLDFRAIKSLQDGAGANKPPSPGSVLYVSFGSGGTLSRAQQGELALGLEMSGQKFLWVARKPNDELASAAYLNCQSQFHPSEVLPNGFLERTKGQGFVVPSWVPQTQILGHGATGGFITHCGWNSTLESVALGIPLIAWPRYAEQKMTAVVLVEDLKVALRPNENGLVGREEIAKVVKDLIEGEEGKRLGQRMRDLKVAASMALSKEGSSTRALSELASKWANVEALR
ncbi:hypothetical protein FNV43_RR18353 [Rhamnella rubrinervis]|uniref:Glycosyltransferase n=1 Tax=Rhamnella rubrinervis TaxID=2594499 RepID=A0A8K0DZ91_9ROSA|nr:hypothetical protein FNV43_RR18353 [Rhamnella rubrinervis]